VNTRHTLGQGLLLALLTLSALVPSLDTTAGWDATSYAGWPGVGLSAAMFLAAGVSREYVVLALQTLALGLALAYTYDVTVWQGAIASVAVTLPGMLAAKGLRPGTVASRRYVEDEVDAYHGVTAAAGLLCGVLSAAAAAVAQRGDLNHVLLVGLISFFAATTAQLVILPFWLPRSSDWTNLGHSLELWGQRVMFVVFTAAIFLPREVLPVSFLLFPVLGWAAIRARVLETHIQMLVVSVAAFVATMAGRGPLALGSIDDPNPFAPLLVYALIASLLYLLIPLALTVHRLTAVTRQATGAATTVSRMLDSATGTVFLGTDPAGRITHYNHGAEQALGFSADEALGRHAGLFHAEDEIARQADFFGLPPAPTGELYASVVAAQIASGQRRNWEFRRKDGGSRSISLNISEMSEPNGAVTAYIASGEDITERLRAQRALEKAFQHEQEMVEALRTANEVKEELVSTVSHELRTPITNIRGFAELLIDGDLGLMSERQTEAVDRIERNSTRLHQMVDDLLTLSSTESQGPEIVRVGVDLNAVALATHDILSSQTAGRILDVRLSPASRPVIVYGDRRLLERAVSNLWSNAIKFTPDGGTIELLVAEPCPDNVYGTLMVRDTGIGIASAEHGDVFTRFYRTAAAGERAIQGSGLGLSIVKAIVDQHEGVIALESEAGVGTTITLGIPSQGAPPEPSLVAGSDSTPAGTTPSALI
jgi:PAS domain S-box-containing protein